MEEEEQQQSLIPGLPDDIALDCLARIPLRFLPLLRPVCTRWRDLLSSPPFLRHRHRIGSAEDLIFLVQALGGPAASATKPSPDLRPPIYALSIYSVTEDTWYRLASPEPIPMFAQCAAVDGKLIIVGGWDPETLEPSADVRIVDLVTGEWRKGRAMSGARSFFACAAVGNKVVVAGGHDGMKNALRTAEMYDVDEDNWMGMPSMGEERDESQGVTIGGKFWAVSGYGTEGQGRFRETGEWYDWEKGEWRMEEGIWSEEGGTAAIFAGAKGMCCAGRRGVREYEESGEWKEAVPPPEGMKGSVCAAAMAGDRVFVMGAAGDGAGGGGYGGWILEAGKWRRVETPAMFSGFAYSAVAVRL